MPTEQSSPVSRRKLGIFAIAAVVVALLVVVSGIRAREDSSAKLREWTDNQAIPTVAVVSPDARVLNATIDLPVKLKVHDSIFVPLAKWAMLLTGNYRCVQKDAARSIKEAVHTDIEESRSVYNWVRELCVKLGASPDDLVPFEKYASAAQGLVRPSSAARALFAGAPNIERVDRLVQSIAAQKGLRNAVLDETVAMVDARLEMNRKAAA